jgi:phenylacetate-CoA ligase
MCKLDSIYKSLPLPLQNAAVSLYGRYWHWLRFGGNYDQIQGGYQQRNQFDRYEWSEYQNKKLKELLSIALEKVHYYQRTWNSTQKKAALEGDLSSLPLLEKEPLRRNPKDFVREDRLNKRTWVFQTSGSTGTPIASIWTLNEIRNSLAVREVRSANWAGVSFKLPRATFSGRIIEPDPDSKGPFYRYNSAEKQVYFSAFHLRPDTSWQYVNALRQHKIQWMTGYAVSFYLLGKFILEAQLEVPPIKAIITTSEKLTPEMRGIMSQAFRCPIYEEYSTVENVLFASECEQGCLHVSPDVGIVEILRPDGSSCEPGEVGEVVATCLIRNYQPFIRYRLGDLAAWDPNPCPCGRTMPVIKEVVGRIEDVVIGPDGRQMVRFHGIFANQPHVVEGQIIQETLKKIRVMIVPSDGFGEEDKLGIIQRVQQRLGVEVEVAVEAVDEIPRSASGKFRAVISKLNDTNQ